MLTKERVFEIMGKYYGNAHYRDAIRCNISEHDLRMDKEILDKINSLGYYFSNLHRLDDTEDIRFVPILLDYYDKYDAPFGGIILRYIRFPSYSEYIPRLISIYEETNEQYLKDTISQCFLQMRCKKYIPEYLRIVNDPNYGKTFDWMMDVLCKLRVREAFPKLLELVKNDPHAWTWTFVWGVPFFRDPSLIPYLEPYLEHHDGEVRSMARKGIKKLSALDETK